MRDGDPHAGTGHQDRAPRVLLLTVILLVPASLLAGCIAEPTTELVLRRGDLVRAEIVVANGTDLVLPSNSSAASPEALCGSPIQDGLERCPQAQATYTLSADAPASLPEGWTDARALPPVLVDALTGLPEEGTLVREDVEVFGPHREGLVQEHAIEQARTRFVDDAEAYGRAWETTRLANGTLRIDPGPEANGTELELPRWCNERFCLFTSTLTGYNQTHLRIQHQPSAGDRMHVEELDTYLAVTRVDASTFTVDGNPPRAGGTYDVFARIVDIRGPPEGTRRAPGFNLTTVDGGHIALDELLGQPVVIEFFATWCPSCVENTDHLDRLEARFGDRIAIVSIGVDPWEGPAALRGFIQSNGVSWPVAVDEDGRVSQAYHVGSLSTEVVVSQTGAIVHTETGVADHERVAGVIEDLLDEHAHAGHDHSHADEASGDPA